MFVCLQTLDTQDNDSDIILFGAEYNQWDNVQSKKWLQHKCILMIKMKNMTDYFTVFAVCTIDFKNR